MVTAARRSGHALHMAEVTQWAGTAGPASGTPPRWPGSVRRTSSVDILWPAGVGGLLRLEGRARDLRTSDDGSGQVVATASTVIEVEKGTVISVETDPPTNAEGLVGHAARSFRRALGEHAADLTTDGSLLGLLLDEVPVTSLISMSALRRAQLIQPDSVLRSGAGPKVDVCAGWIAGGVMVSRITSGERPLYGEGPHLPSLLRHDDPLAWHEQPSLPEQSMRRRRRLDLTRTADGNMLVDSLFRDAYFEDDGSETGVHEYGLTATIDGETLAVTSIDITPRVLPGPDCPNAVASAQRLVGRRLPEIRALVRAEFEGTSTCTHLNDELRAFGDLHTLVALI